MTRIRPATLKDAETITAFNCGVAWDSEQVKLNPVAARQAVETVLQDPTKGFYLLAEADGQVIGQLMITFEWSDWRNGNFWWIQSVFTHPDFRKQGVFKHLFQEVSRLAKQDGGVCGLRLYVDKKNDIARQAYLGLGMQVCHYDMMEIDVNPAEPNPLG